MDCQFDFTPLSTICKEFIKAKRNLKANGHQKRNMFIVTCSFIDAEGLRFTAVTNCPYDYLDYKPMVDMFLIKPTLDSFEEYVDLMFNDIDDWCYFKILRKILPEDFADYTSIVQCGKYQQQPSTINYRVPICIIPIVEFQTMEDYSSVYRGQSACHSL
jgi:hypothetical protein